MVLEGRPRTQAAELNGMDRQTLRDWIHRYNAQGVEGLVSRRSPGRTRALSSLQRAELLALVRAGPDPEINGVVGWRCVDLQSEVERRFGVKAHGHTIARWLHELGLTRLQPRRYHPKKDPLAETAFKKILRFGQSRAWRNRSVQPDRNLVPGRGPRRPEGRPCRHLGASRLAPPHGARQPARLHLYFRCHLSRPRRRSRHDHALCQHPSYE